MRVGVSEEGLSVGPVLLKVPALGKRSTMHPNMTSKEAEIPPEQVEPVDLSVRTTSKTSADSHHTNCKALRDHPGVVLKVPTFPSIALQTLGLDLSLKAVSDSPPSPVDPFVSLEALRTGSTTLLSIQKLRETSLALCGKRSLSESPSPPPVTGSGPPAAHLSSAVSVSISSPAAVAAAAASLLSPSNSFISSSSSSSSSPPSPPVGSRPPGRPPPPPVSTSCN